MSKIRERIGINDKRHRKNPQLGACEVPGALVAARQPSFALQAASAVRCPDIEVGSGTDAGPLAVRVILTLEPQSLADAPSLVQYLDDLPPTARIP